MRWLEVLTSIASTHFEFHQVPGTSHATCSSQTLWRRIFMVTIVGANHPRISNTFAMSETRIHFVTKLASGELEMVRQNVSVEVFHSRPKVLV